MRQRTSQIRDGAVNFAAQADPHLVQGRGHLPVARQGVLRLQRRRHRRLPRADRAARLRARPRRQHRVAAAVLPLAAAGRRLRRRRLPQRECGVRTDGRLPGLRARGAPARPAGDHRADRQPHVGPAPLVPGGAARAPRLEQAELLRLERRSSQVRRHADHLHGHREVELGVGRRRAGLLLAPLLQPPAGPELRQPAGAEGDIPRHAALAGDGRRRLPARCDSLPGGARGHEQRKPARDARGAEAAARGGRRELPGPVATRGSQSVARGRARVLRRRRRVPHGVPLSADAAHVHGDRAGEPPSDHRDHAADAGHPGQLPVGRSSCAITTS